LKLKDPKREQTTPLTFNENQEWLNKIKQSEMILPKYGKWKKIHNKFKAVNYLKHGLKIAKSHVKY
jgi:hypothetical protein